MQESKIISSQYMIRRRPKTPPKGEMKRNYREGQAPIPGNFLYECDYE